MLLGEFGCDGFLWRAETVVLGKCLVFLLCIHKIFNGHVFYVFFVVVVVVELSDILSMTLNVTKQVLTPRFLSDYRESKCSPSAFISG